MSYSKKFLKRTTSRLALLRRLLYFYLTRIGFILSSKHDKSVVLYGEKDGYEARDNSFQLFLYMNDISLNDGLDHIYIINKRSKDLDIVKHSGKPYLIQNSYRHVRALHRAKFLVINDGFLDVSAQLPLTLKKFDIPFIYLQHGIIRYKTLFFTREHYIGRILAFITSLDSETEIVKQKMRSKRDHADVIALGAIANASGWKKKVQSVTDLKEISNHFQKISEALDIPESSVELKKRASAAMRLVRSTGLAEARIIQSGLPRHDRLCKLIQDKVDSNSNDVTIALFFTWRDANYHRRNEALPEGNLPLHIEAINAICTAYAQTSVKVKICLASHQKDQPFEEIDLINNNDLISLVQGHDDLQRLMVKADLFITDYSSIAFDFDLANTPVIFFQPDFEDYIKTRGTYTDTDSDWIGVRAKTVAQLVTEISQFRSSKTKGESKIRSEYPNFGNSLRTISEFIVARKPRYLFLTYNIYGIGGTVRVVVNLANYLYRSGYHVEILSLRRHTNATVLGLDPGIRIHTGIDDRKGQQKFIHNILSRIPSILVHRQSDLYHRLNIITDWALLKRIRQSTCDVIVPTFPGMVPASLRIKRSGARIFIQENKFFDAYPSGIQALIRKYYTQAFGLSVLTEKDKASYDFCPSDTVAVIPNGINPDAELSDDASRNEIVALGRLDAQKQFHLLIASFSRIASRFPDWVVKIYGTGEEEDNLRGQIAELGLEKQIKLMGSTPKSRFVISEAKICAFTSAYEGFGMVYIEAFATKRPVITFDIEGGPKMFAQDEYNCLKVSPFDVDEYASKLAQLIEDPRLRDKIAENGWETYHKNYTIDVTGEKFLMASNPFK